MKTAKIEEPKGKSKPLPDLAAAKPGDNGPDVPTILFHIGRIKEKRAFKKAAAKAESAARKQAILSGLVIEDLNEIMAEMEMDPADVVAKWVRRAQYSAAVGTPIGQQMTIFQEIEKTTIPSFKERGEKAHQLGYARGIMGEFPDDQAFDMLHEHYKDHQAGWRAGQDELLKRIAKLEATEAPETKAEPAPEPVH